METDWGKWGCIAIGVAFLLLCGYGLLSSKPIGHGYFQVELAEPPAHFLQEPEGLRPMRIVVVPWWYFLPPVVIALIWLAVGLLWDVELPGSEKEQRFIAGLILVLLVTLTFLCFWWIHRIETRAWQGDYERMVTTKG